MNCLIDIDDHNAFFNNLMNGMTYLGTNPPFYEFICP